MPRYTRSRFTSRLSVSYPPDAYRDLVAVARRHGMGVSEFVRFLLLNTIDPAAENPAIHIRHHKSLALIARRMAVPVNDLVDRIVSAYLRAQWDTQKPVERTIGKASP